MESMPHHASRATHQGLVGGARLTAESDEHIRAASLLS
jgi:hypothetical protein